MVCWQLCLNPWRCKFAVGISFTLVIFDLELAVTRAERPTNGATAKAGMRLEPETDPALIRVREQLTSSPRVEKKSDEILPASRAADSYSRGTMLASMDAFAEAFDDLKRHSAYMQEVLASARATVEGAKHGPGRVVLVPMPVDSRTETGSALDN
mmetsp:Transcript_140450/g.261840  ORF Transcript_140450/g.261840 Transcript_140450/m.261840 type:complete len:155 (+) Transcript_140450:77-541(+)